MIDLYQLVEAHITAFQNIAEVVLLLSNQDSSLILGYFDVSPDENDVDEVIYSQPAGSVYVFWWETNRNQDGTMSRWVHRFRYVVRAAEGGSALDLMTALINGVPVPGDGQRWRLCPLMAGVDPTEITQIERIRDEEQVDYYAITAEIAETGDA